MRRWMLACEVTLWIVIAAALTAPQLPKTLTLTAQSLRQLPFTTLN
jgi:hypothetical protein